MLKVFTHSLKFLDRENIPILLELLFQSRGDYIVNTLETIFNSFPLHGYGLGSLQTMDSGLIFYMWTGGMISLFLTFCIFLVVFTKAIIAMLSNRSEDGSYLFFSWIAILFAFYAGPILVANRVAIFIWFFMVLFFIRLNKTSKIPV